MSTAERTESEEVVSFLSTCSNEALASLFFRVVLLLLPRLVPDWTNALAAESKDVTDLVTRLFDAWSRPVDVRFSGDAFFLLESCASVRVPLRLFVAEHGTLVLRETLDRLDELWSVVVVDRARGVVARFEQFSHNASLPILELVKSVLDETFKLVLAAASTERHRSVVFDVLQRLCEERERTTNNAVLRSVLRSFLRRWRA